MVRAEVVIRRSPSREMRLEAVSIGDLGEAEVVQLNIDKTAGAIRLSDMFPPRPQGWIANECLPPAGERGDFWRNTTRFRIVLLLPDDVNVSGHVMDGQIDDQRVRRSGSTSSPVPCS